MQKLLAILAGIGVFAAALGLSQKKEDKLFKDIKIKIDEEKISRPDIIVFSDIISWFRKKIKGDKSKIAFIANSSFAAKFMEKEDFEKIKAGKDGKSLFLGIYSKEKDELFDYQILVSKKADNKTVDTLGDKEIVVLE